MTYRDHQRLADILAAIDAIRAHLSRGELFDGLIFDTSHAVLQGTVDHDLPELEEAVRRLASRLAEAGSDTD